MELDEVECVAALVGDVIVTVGGVLSGVADAAPDTSPDSALDPDALYAATAKK